MSFARVATVVLALATALSAQNNPVPFINNPVEPSSVMPHGADFTLTVTGSGFVSGSVVQWNGTPLTTTFIAVTKLTALVPSANTATGRVASIFVKNPPPGGGRSNVGLVQITAPTSSVSFVNSSISGSVNGAGAASGDFNGDGKPDLAVTGYPTNRFDNGFVQIMLNNGDGTFQAPVDYFVQIGPGSLAIGDFNRDGRLDLAVANYCGTDSTCSGNKPGSLSILLGNGDGTFAPAQNYTSVDGARWVVAGDLNGDGNLDVVVDSLSGLSIFLGNGDGTFQTPLSGSYGGQSLAIGDINNDGILDLIYPICVELGKGNGTFQPPICPGGLINPWGIVVADFNHDGNLDLAAVDEIYAKLEVVLGHGDGTFGAPVDYSLGAQGFALVSADFNADGNIDLLADTNGEVLFLGNGDGSFQSEVAVAGFYGSSQLIPGDFNNDGRIDLLTGDSNSGVNVLFQTNGFAVPASISFPPVLIGQQSLPMNATFTNTGNKPAWISSITIDDTADFSQANTCGAYVPAGKTCTIRVNFAPTVISYHSGTLTIASSAIGAPEKVSLYGVGTAAQLTPPSLDFGAVPLRTTSAAQTLTLTNVGTAPFGLYGYNTTPSEGHNKEFVVTATTCGAKLVPGASCTFSVTFTPHRHGQRTSNFELLDNGSLLLETQTRPLKGRGVAGQGTH